MNGKNRSFSSAHELSGAPSRDVFAAVAEHALRRAHREGEFMSLLCFEVVYASEPPAQPGPPPNAVADFGELLRRDLRASDVVAHLGEGEVAVLLPQTDAKQAAVVVAHIEGALLQRKRDRAARELLVRIGYSTNDPAATLASVQQMISQAQSVMFELADIRSIWS